MEKLVREKLAGTISEKRLEEQASARRLLNGNANLHKSITEGFTVSLMVRRLDEKRRKGLVKEFSTHLGTSLEKVMEGLDELIKKIDTSYPLKKERKFHLLELKKDLKKIKDYTPTTSLYRFENLLEKSFDKTIYVNCYAATAILYPLCKTGFREEIENFLDTYFVLTIKNYARGETELIPKHFFPSLKKSKKDKKPSNLQEKSEKNQKSIKPKGKVDKRIYAYFELKLILSLSKEGVIRIPEEKWNYFADGGYWEVYGLSPLKPGLKKFEKERISPKTLFHSYLQTDSPLCRAKILLDSINHLLRIPQPYDFYHFL